MDSQRFEQRLATAGTFKIKKYPNGDHNINITDICLTSTATSTVAFSDGTKSVTFDVGPNGPTTFDLGLCFLGDADITVTNTGGTTTIICNVTYKR